MMNQPENPKKKAGGRPQKEEAEKRSHPGWGFTSAEIDRINEEFSKSKEAYIGAFIYKMVTGQPIAMPKMVTFPEDLKRDFKNLGNNLNQIAVALNAKKSDPLAKAMLEKLELIGQQYTFLVQRLSEK